MVTTVEKIKEIHQNKPSTVYFSTGCTISLRIQVCPKKRDYFYNPILGMGFGPSILRKSGGVWILRV